MSTIAIDPGVTTGVAVFDDDDLLVRTFACRDPYLELVQELTARHDATVILERPPTGKKHQPEATDRVIGLVTRYAPSSPTLIAPAAWKSHPAGFRGRKRSEASQRTVHELDACGIGAYWIEVAR